MTTPGNLGRDESDPVTETSGAMFRVLPAAGWRHYLRLGVNAFATMLDLGLFAVGAGVVGLAASLILVGFGLVEADLEMSTGALLVSALVLAVVGAFFAGVASEGPVRRNRPIVGHNDFEITLARAAASVVVGAMFLLVAGRLAPLLEEMPAPFLSAVDLLRVAGRVGLWVMPLIGLPLSLGVKRTALLGEAVEETDLPLLFAVWAMAIMLLR
jgi:hypothetical protein